MARVLQNGPHLIGRAGTKEFTTVHDCHTGSQGKRLLQPVLSQKDGCSELPVDLAQGGKEIRRGNGIQLAGGLVQDEDRGLHGHDGGQIQKLLLAPGQLGHIFIKPGLDAEERGHFSHPAADGWGVVSQALQSKGQLVPHLIGDDLVIRGLLDKADALRLLPLVQLVQREALKQDLTAPSAVRGQDSF